MLKRTEDGTILLNQGDSGYVRILGLDETSECDVCLAFSNKERMQIGGQIIKHADHVSFIDLFIPTSITDLLTVPAKKMQETYYYGVKIYKTDENHNLIEDTVLPELSKQRTVIVYPKWVEGPM